MSTKQTQTVGKFYFIEFNSGYDARGVPKFRYTAPWKRLNASLISFLYRLTILVLLPFGHQAFGQSTNCGCTGSLLTNGTFEGDNLSGWSVSGSANVNFNNDYDDCGSVSLRLSRSNGSGLLDPIIWQQESNIDVGKIYTLSFDAGTHDPGGTHRVFLRFYSSSGTLLSEDFLEINHDVDSDDQLDSYTFSLAAPANASYVRVELALDEDKLYFDNVCLVKASCTAPTFNFQSPTLVSGVDSEVGAVYEFLNVVAGTNALMTIVGKSHPDVVVQSVDEPEITNGGYDWAFQPIIDYNYYNGGGANDPAGDKSVTFRFDFVDAFTGELVYIPQLNVTGVDIDGNGGTIREFIEASNFNYYEIQSPTELTLSGSLRALGNIPSWPGVTETALTTMISYVYSGQSSVEVTYGSTYNGGSHSSDGSEDRMNCLYFKCYDFNTTVACPTISVSGGNAVCNGGSLTLQASTSGGNGTCNIQWQSSSDGTNWTDISGATGTSYTTPGLVNTTYYRAAYYCTGNACGTIISSAETVTALPTCAEICNNNIDDDGDGYIDENDSDCANYETCEATPGESIITGIVFNDGNNNLNFDNGEFTPSGVIVEIYEDENGNGNINGNDMLIGTATTDGSGSYSLEVNPVFNATYDAHISDPCDDARDGNEGENKIEIGEDEEIGLRFRGVNIPAGATINSAFLYFVSKNNEDDDGSVTIYGEDDKRPDDFCTNDDVIGRDRTSASVNWNVGNWLEDQTYQSKDISPIIQELVDNHGKYNNDEMVIIMISDGDDDVEAKTFETNGSSAEAPRLVINYSTGETVNYLVKIDETTIPAGTTLNSANLASVAFTATGEADCNNNFSFTGSFEICNNGIDDDLDGFVDENDADCIQTPDCTATPDQNDIIGTVYQDVNRNALIDNGDVIQSGITLQLHQDNNGNGVIDGGDTQLQTDVSDTNGHYSFTVNPVFSASESASINSGCDDAKDEKEDENKLEFGKNKEIGLRFTGITIPSGSTINSAYLYFTSNKDEDEFGSVSIYGEDVANPANFCSNDEVESRTRTTANVNWNMGNWFEGVEYQSTDIKNVVQELVNSHNYNNGVMSFIMISTGDDNVQAKSYETNGDGTEVPRLVINYGSVTPYHYIVEADGATLPANTEFTTPNIATAVFTTAGTIDCNNDFGFASTVEVCDNGVDDDGDGLTDCEDPDCFNGLNATATNTGGAVCPGDAVTLNVTGTGGTPPYTFNWSNGLGSGSSKVVNPLSSSTYTVTVTDANGCSANGLVNAIVQSCPEDCTNGIDDDLDNLTDCEDPDCNNNLAISISGGSNLCRGSNITLTATASGGNGSYTFTWSESLGQGTSKTVSPLSDITYYVTVSDGNGCTKEGSVFIDVKSPPEATASGGVSICSGNSSTISATASGGDEPYTFSWSNGLGTGSSKMVSPTNTTTYTVTVTSGNGCTDTDQVTVTVNQLPTVQAGADQTLCASFSTILTGTAVGGTSPYTYTWDHGLGNGASHTVSPSATTTYTLTVVSANGCNSADQVTIAVQSCPEICDNGIDDDGDGLTDCEDPDCGPSVDAGADVNLCAGSSTALMASAAGGIGPYIYTWSNGLGVGQSHNVSPLTDVTYTVTVSMVNGCTAEDQVSVTVITCGEDCTNGIDDDGDGLVDCDDPDCFISSAPNLVDDIYTSCPAMPYSDRVTYNDDNLQNPVFSIYTYPASGTVTIDQTGKFTFTPANTECQTVEFAYQVCNQATGCCSQANVTLNLGDVSSPTLANIPADLTITCDDAIPMPPNIIAFDECPGIYMDYEETSTQHYVGACESYTLTRTWVATDLCGNQTTGVQNINIIDNTKPEIFQVYTLENGKRVIGGVVHNVTQDWKFVPFPITFSETPMVFTTIVSNTESSAKVVRQRNAYSQGFEVRLSEQENSDGILQGESVAWMAIESGLNVGSLKLEAGRWDNINHVASMQSLTPIFWDDPGLITTMQSTNDMDPSGVRINNLTDASVSVNIQEETSDDAETDHGLEHIGYLAFRAGEELKDERKNQFGETGKVNVTNAWTSVTLSGSYTKPVVILGGISTMDSDPVNVRVRNVTNNSFEVRLQEWDYLDGNHSTESVSWVVMEGAIPGNNSYYCSSNAAELKVGVNVFAIDNCDDQIAFGYTESPSVNGNGAITIRTWMAIDDCGNTNLISRYDTCATAAVSVKAILHGPLINNGNNGLMRDDLRVKEIVPLEEPFSSLPAFPHVEDTTPEPSANGSNNGGNEVPDGYVLVCHKPGTSEEKTMLVSEAALNVHLAHGDVVDGCGGETSTEGIPAGANAADYKTVADGEWIDPATWESGNVPPTGTIENKKISIEHDVTVSFDKIKIKDGSELFVTHGSLSINNDRLEIKDAAMYVHDSHIYVYGEYETHDEEAVLEIFNSTVEVGDNFHHHEGKRWLENVHVIVHDEYHNHDIDTLINAVINCTEKFHNKDDGKMHAIVTKIKSENGDIENEDDCKLTGGGLVLLVENGHLMNDGNWSAEVVQYCVSGSAIGLGGILPISEDCSGMQDYFAPGSGLVFGIDPIDPATNDDDLSTAEIALEGTLDPILLTIDGDDAIVDWMLMEIRDPDTEEVVDYATVAMQRDGDIVSEDGESIINFPTLLEGEYYVTLRHRNHLSLMTDEPIFLSINNPPMLDFTDLAFPVRGDNVGGNESGSVRKLWGGDFNEDDRVIYQGPNNDIFYLFSRVLSEENNTEYLANYIVQDYDLHDFNLDGQVIFQGPNNDRASLLYHTVLSHLNNSGFLANYIVGGTLP